MTNGYNNPPARPGAVGSAPIVDHARIIDIQKALNDANPLPLHVQLTGKLDERTTERLFRQFGDVRNLKDADPSDPENARLQTMPPALRNTILAYQGAAATREGREARSEHFRPFVGSRAPAADIALPEGKAHSRDKVPPIIAQFQKALLATAESETFSAAQMAPPSPAPDVKPGSHPTLQ